MRAVIASSQCSNDGSGSILVRTYNTAFAQVDAAFNFMAY